MPHQDQLQKIATAPGFIAALDQSGGSTPKALAQYGVPDSAYSNDGEMFDRIHEMRARIISCPGFNGDKIIGAILFEKTLDRDVEGMRTPSFLWERKSIVPFLKIDRGLLAEENGVQLMKPIDGLEDTLARAKVQPILGTKMRSVINTANPDGIKAVVDQQFDIAETIVGLDLVPIIEPEVSIKAADKRECETLLRDNLRRRLDALPSGDRVMFKLTLPEDAEFYRPLLDDPRVARVVALSGGYSREEANRRLAENRGVTASFSRALTEGLGAQQSDAEFNRILGESIDAIHAASIT